MHPAFVAWWHAARRGAHGAGPWAFGECRSRGACGPGAFHHGGPGAWFGGRCGPGGGGGGGGADDGSFGGGFGDGGFGGPFGVRRPLRFLAYKLELEDAQVAELATVLDELKTERAQAAVDQRRTTSAFADAVASDTFDAAKIEAIRSERVKSAERLQSAVGRALGRIHALLDAEQRKKLAYLIRTGALSL